MSVTYQQTRGGGAEERDFTCKERPTGNTSSDSDNNSSNDKNQPPPGPERQRLSGYPFRSRAPATCGYRPGPRPGALKQRPHSASARQDHTAQPCAGHSWTSNRERRRDPYTPRKATSHLQRDRRTEWSKPDGEDKRRVLSPHAQSKPANEAKEKLVDAGSRQVTTRGGGRQDASSTSHGGQEYGDRVSTSVTLK